MSLQQVPQPQRVLLVRHGQGEHNARSGGEHNYNRADPPLTEKGLKQASALRENAAFSGCELLVVSPLSRAVQTAATIFGETPNCRVVITPLHSERWSGLCDEGRRKSELAKDFPYVANWEGFHELAEAWTPTRESDREWQDCRVPAFRQWLLEQSERRVVCVGHGAFFQGLSGRYLDNCEVMQLEGNAA